MLAKLWNDESGVISVEYLFLVTIVGLGLVVAFTTLRNAITAEYVELSNAILGLSQTYSFEGISGCSAATEGTAVTDTPSSVSYGTTTVTATAIDVVACP